MIYLGFSKERLVILLGVLQLLLLLRMKTRINKRWVLLLLGLKLVAQNALSILALTREKSKR
jgi:hypothetical protein